MGSNLLRSTAPTTAGRFERLLLFGGLLLICVYTSTRIFSVVYSHHMVQEFRQTHAASSSSPGDFLRVNAGIPDFRLRSSKRVAAYQSSLITDTATPLGVLTISSVGVEVLVLEGTDELTLNRAVGHIEGTPLPGEAGNIGIAGHRDGFFRALKDVRQGDYVDLYTGTGNIRYVVDQIHIVPPEDVSVLAARPKPSLTLVTCYPFYFVGSAPLRYIVHASAVDDSKLKKSGQPNASQAGGGRDRN